MSTTNNVDGIADKSKLKNGMRSDYYGWSVEYLHGINFLRSIALAEAVKFMASKDTSPAPRGEVIGMVFNVPTDRLKELVKRIEEDSKAAAAKKDESQAAGLNMKEQQQYVWSENDEDEEEDDDDDFDMPPVCEEPPHQTMQQE